VVSHAKEVFLIERGRTKCVKLLTHNWDNRDKIVKKKGEEEIPVVPLDPEPSGDGETELDTEGDESYGTWSFCVCIII